MTPNTQIFISEIVLFWAESHPKWALPRTSLHLPDANERQNRRGNWKPSTGCFIKNSCHFYAKLKCWIKIFLEKSGVYAYSAKLSRMGGRKSWVCSHWTDKMVKAGKGHRPRVRGPRPWPFLLLRMVCDAISHDKAEKAETQGPLHTSLTDYDRDTMTSSHL